LRLSVTVTVDLNNTVIKWDGQQSGLSDMIGMDNRAAVPFGYCSSTAILSVRENCANARWNRW